MPHGHGIRTNEAPELIAYGASLYPNAPDWTRTSDLRLRTPCRCVGPSQKPSSLGRSFTIIGVGGVLSAADAVSKIQSGANLVQIYTGLIYEGPNLVWQSARAIQAHGS